MLRFFQWGVIKEFCNTAKTSLTILETGGFGGLWSHLGTLRAGWPRQLHKTSATSRWFSWIPLSLLPSVSGHWGRTWLWSHTSIASPCLHQPLGTTAVQVLYPCHDGDLTPSQHDLLTLHYRAVFYTGLRTLLRTELPRAEVLPHIPSPSPLSARCRAGDIPTF